MPAQRTKMSRGKSYSNLRVIRRAYALSKVGALS